MKAIITTAEMLQAFCKLLWILIQTASFKDGPPKVMNLLKGPNIPASLQASQTGISQWRVGFLSRHVRED